MLASWATLWQVPEALAFIIANREKGNLDSNIFNYPSTRILRVENGSGAAMLYMPMHTGLVIETLGWAPDLDAAQKTAVSIEALTQAEREAYAVGVREVYFVSSDERTDRFAEERLGYERVTCLRKRL